MQTIDSMDYYACGYMSTADAVEAIMEAIALIADIQPAPRSNADIRITENSIEIDGCFKAKVIGSSVRPTLRLRIRFFLRHFRNMHEVSRATATEHRPSSRSPLPACFLPCTLALQVLLTIDLPCYRYAFHDGRFYTVDSAAHALSHRTSAVDWRTPPHR